MTDMKKERAIATSQEEEIQETSKEVQTEIHFTENPRADILLKTILDIQTSQEDNFIKPNSLISQ